MRDHKEPLDAVGIAVAAIGTGDIAYAQDFKAQRKIDFPLLVDEARATYRVVGASRTSLPKTVSPKILISGARAATNGVMQGRVGRDPLLLGATHLILPDGGVAFAWLDRDVADSAPVAEVLAAVQ